MLRECFGRETLLSFGFSFSPGDWITEGHEGRVVRVGASGRWTVGKGDWALAIGHGPVRCGAKLVGKLVELG